MGPSNMKSTIVENILGKIPKFYLYLTFFPSPVSMLSVKSESLCVYLIVGNPTLSRGCRGRGNDKHIRK